MLVSEFEQNFQKKFTQRVYCRTEIFIFFSVIVMHRKHFIVIKEYT